MLLDIFLKKAKDLFRGGAGRRPFALLSLAILLVTLNPQVLSAMPLRQASIWSTPQNIPGYNPATWPPIMIADQNRTVHAFSAQRVSNPGEASIQAIVYNQWSLENGWTNPVDIVMSPYLDARLTDVYLDKNGIFHMTFFGGDGTSADIYYTKAPAAQVTDSRSWSPPVIVGENAGDPEGAAIVEDDQGTIFVIFNGREMGNGLYVVSSKDGGENWSNPSPMFFTQSDEPNIYRLDVMESKSGRFHAIWGVYSDDGQGRGIYYSGSANGQEWSEPFLLVDADGGLGTQTPAIIEYNDTLIAFYNIPPKIMMRRSMDDGKTWDNPSILFPRHRGVNGSLAPVIDGKNVLHLFFGQRISGNPDIHGMWHSILKGDRWTEPNAVAKGPRVWDTEGITSFDPYEAHAVVSQGNVILVTWITDPGNRVDNGVFYSYSVLDAPESPVATLPAPAAIRPASTATSLVVPVATGTGTPLPTFDRDPEDPRPLSWVVLGSFVIGLLGIGYVLFIRSR